MSKNRHREVEMFLHGNRDRAVSYTHLRAHETRLYLVCRLLLEKNLFLMIRRPPRYTLSRSSAASDVYKRQAVGCVHQESDSTPTNEHARTDHQPSKILVCEELAIIASYSSTLSALLRVEHLIDVERLCDFTNQVTTVKIGFIR